MGVGWRGRMCYGYDVLEAAASWQRYEVVIAEYVSALLSGLNGQRLRKLLEKLGMPADFQCASVDKTMTFGTVATVHSRSWINPKARYENESGEVKECAGTRKEVLKELLDKCMPPTRQEGAPVDTAVVIVNGSGAPYADIIVVIPGVAVVLVQCKYYGPDTELTAEMIEHEADKLSAEFKALKTTARVPSDAFFRVPCNQQN
ncbi:Hypothetical protein, putative [Bodo saltans]|uniref:Uncharacterized protein n=1 Tax=Bodo saltans TaxID=75058 RepID=A0A0S4KK18_BODSA|nr:Hypothetical protein, putative [Bodo saltans]|eukprot:CUI12908.1 Hypothetical protein, putative [Bodo saltans]